MYRRFFLFFSLFYIGMSSIIIITLTITLILNDCPCIALVPSVLPFPLPVVFPTPGAGGLCVPLPSFMYLLSFLSENFVGHWKLTFTGREICKQKNPFHLNLNQRHPFNITEFPVDFRNLRWREGT